MFRSIADGGAGFGLYLEVEPGILGVEFTVVNLASRLRFFGVYLLGATIDCRIYDAELNSLAYETRTVLDCSHDRPSSAETSLADNRLTNQKDRCSLWNYMYPSLCSGHSI